MEVRDREGELVGEYLTLTICYELQPWFKTLPLTILDADGKTMREDP